MAVNRRLLLRSAGLAAGAACAGWAPALAKPEDARAEIERFTAGKPAHKGRVKLDLPEIAENGNGVPLTVSVESPMTEASHVVAVLVVAEHNPRARVATFLFSPESGVAEATTRIRLAASQWVTAVARLSDGSYWQDRREVRVTVGGCTS
ncbi:MAG: thiosulfate oxidation carrier protein SoxY [Alphaproteobacteria bacterium]|nr:thiosulfate oxidation carrier protein SoxY [Alphaproteobacteria bacterium]